MARVFSKDYRVEKFTWDVPEDGGAVGTIALGNLPTNFVVQKMEIYVETALTGGGSCTLGNDGGSADADGYATDMDALSAGTITRGQGELLFTAGDTEDKDESHLVTSSADGVVVTVSTTPYTAGRLHFYFCGYSLDE